MNADFTKSLVILIVATVVVASFSILVWVLPNLLRTPELVAESQAKPLTAIEVAGRDIYISEGCHVCHTQMVRPLEPETKRNGRANQDLTTSMNFQTCGAQNELVLISRT
ncbi:cytochrome c oxidase subunit CcoO [Vibrio variabilis]|uniref:Cytochrome c oxidase subunit CcoO n=1 Tax=Vibrio variabilis TaxID=990271 RepID=A0ABQ0JE51_9VIBR|nr:cytochrome c oxidase subunit CcoO [Vibrio variabilis]